MFFPFEIFPTAIPKKPLALPVQRSLGSLLTRERDWVHSDGKSAATLIHRALTYLRLGPRELRLSTESTSQELWIESQVVALRTLVNALRLDDGLGEFCNGSVVACPASSGGSDSAALAMTLESSNADPKGAWVVHVSVHKFCSSHGLAPHFLLPCCSNTDIFYQNSFRSSVSRYGPGRHLREARRCSELQSEWASRTF